MAYKTSGDMGFGIKEVADVGFYKQGTVKIDATGKVVSGTPLFVLDTLRVSNIENTAEQTEAKGGKGNAPLIIWDYGREVNITLQDAVLSMDALSMMFEGEAKEGNEITISANTFPGTYSVVGKTFARNMNGEDSLFTWYVPKAKVNSEVTLTMEAEGDPTVFDMTLRVLRDSDGTMVKLIRDTSTGVNNYDAMKDFEATTSE